MYLTFSKSIERSKRILSELLCKINSGLRIKTDIVSQGTLYQCVGFTKQRENEIAAGRKEQKNKEEKYKKYQERLEELNTFLKKETRLSKEVFRQNPAEMKSIAETKELISDVKYKLRNKPCQEDKVSS